MWERYTKCFQAQNVSEFWWKIKMRVEDWRHEMDCKEVTYRWDVESLQEVKEGKERMDHLGEVEYFLNLLSEYYLFRFFESLMSQEDTRRWKQQRRMSWKYITNRMQNGLLKMQSKEYKRKVISIHSSLHGYLYFSLLKDSRLLKADPNDLDMHRLHNYFKGHFMLKHPICLRIYQLVSRSSSFWFPSPLESLFVIMASLMQLRLQMSRCDTWVVTRTTSSPENPLVVKTDNNFATTILRLVGNSLIHEED